MHFQLYYTIVCNSSLFSLLAPTNSVSEAPCSQPMHAATLRCPLLLVLFLVVPQYEVANAYTRIQLRGGKRTGVSGRLPNSLVS